MNTVLSQDSEKISEQLDLDVEERAGIRWMYSAPLPSAYRRPLEGVSYGRPISDGHAGDAGRLPRENVPEGRLRSDPGRRRPLLRGSRSRNCCQQDRWRTGS